VSSYYSMHASYHIIIQVLQLAYTTQACILNLTTYAMQVHESAHNLESGEWCGALECSSMKCGVCVARHPYRGGLVGLGWIFPEYTPAPPAPIFIAPWHERQARRQRGAPPCLGWLGLAPSRGGLLSGLGPWWVWSSGWASSLLLSFTLSRLTPFRCIPLVFGVDSCKVLILPVQVEFG
jgi:hypothetical protein